MDFLLAFLFWTYQCGKSVASGIVSLFSALSIFSEVIPYVQSIASKVPIQRFIKEMKTDKGQEQIQNFAEEKGVEVPQILTFDFFKQISVVFNVVMLFFFAYHRSFRIDFRGVKRSHQVGFYGFPQKPGYFEEQGSDNQIQRHVMVWAPFNSLLTSSLIFISSLILFYETQLVIY